jgi:hypothetical protein
MKRGQFHGLHIASSGMLKSVSLNTIIQVWRSSRWVCSLLSLMEVGGGL